MEKTKRRLQYERYYKKHRDKILKKCKVYREANKDKLSKKRKEKRLEKKFILREQDIELKDIMTIKRKQESFDKFTSTNVNYQIAHKLRNRIRLALYNNGTNKSKTSLELLGAPISVVREHLEKQFDEKMNWNNHGKWHIDHIIPCASFDLTNQEDQKKCFHYTNLQPLWAEDNIKKKDSIV